MFVIHVVVICVHFDDFAQIKEAMFDANREHKDTLTRMEQKFFEEKVCSLNLLFRVICVHYQVFIDSDFPYRKYFLSVVGPVQLNFLSFLLIV